MKRQPELIAKATATTITEPTSYHKPYISPRLHKRIVKMVQYYHHYYDTKKGLVWLSGKPHRIVIIKDKVYFQHQNEAFRSLKREEGIINMMQNSIMDGIRQYFA